MKARILGTGSYLPGHIMTNDDMAGLVETNDEWIRERTGIRQRHLTERGTVSMAYEASIRALQESCLTASELDLILVATVSPDYLVPSASCQLQERLGAMGVPAMDLNAACSGFLFALNTAAAYIQAGLYRRILVVGAETLSRMVDWRDRSTCILFGDGAGAVVVGADEEDGILAMEMGCDGSKGMVLSCEGTPIQNPIITQTGDGGKLHMDGQAVFKFAIRQIPKTIRAVLAQTEFGLEDIDHFILHQANRRIIASAAKSLGIPMEKIPMNIERCGNLAAASIPLVLDEYCRAGKIRRGDKVVLSGFGGGLSWGSAVLSW